MQYTQNCLCNPSVFSAQNTDADFNAEVLLALFNENFSQAQASESDLFGELGTRLYGNASEPIYLPASARLSDYIYKANAEGEASNNDKIAWQDALELSDLPAGNKLFFTRDYFASALHEIAHWCLAGKQRRTQVDYGYWYAPDGRNQEQQAAFEKVEVKPQAIEWAFSMACGKTFKVSNDNLSMDNNEVSDFSDRVFLQVQNYIEHGFPVRAQQFLEALHKHFKTQDLSIQISSFAKSNSEIKQAERLI